MTSRRGFLVVFALNVLIAVLAVLSIVAEPVWLKYSTPPGSYDPVQFALGLVVYGVEFVLSLLLRRKGVGNPYAVLGSLAVFGGLIVFTSVHFALGHWLHHS